MIREKGGPSQKELRKIWSDFNAEVNVISREQNLAIKAFGKRLVDQKISNIHHTLERAYGKAGNH